MNKRHTSKPFVTEREEIKGQLNELLYDVKTEVNGSLYIPKNIDDFLTEPKHSVKFQEKEEPTVYHEPTERIRPSGLPPVKYLVSQKAFDEVNKLKDKYGWNNEEELEETIFRLAIQDNTLDLINGDLKESKVYDSDLGDFVKTIEEIKYVISSEENEGNIKSNSKFKEIVMSSALPTDTIYIGDLDNSTQKKINNFQHGGSSHEIFEPYNHEWENEKSKE